MSINRRGFFSVLGVAGFMLAVGKKTAVSIKGKSNIEFFGILHEWIFGWVIPRMPILRESPFWVGE